MRALSDWDLEWLWTELGHAVFDEKSLPGELRDLAKTVPTTRCGAALTDLAAALERGKTLAQAVAEGGSRFPPGAAAAIEAGERSRRLSDTFQALADQARADYTLRHAITTAISYPLVIALFAGLVIVLLNVFIVPQFRDIFRELDVALPALTLMVLGMPTLSLLFLLTPALLLFVLYVIPAQYLPPRRFLDAVRLGIPGVGGMLRMALLARWCGRTGILVNAGVTEPVAVRLAGESAGNAVMLRTTGAMSVELANGERLSTALERRKFFPPVLGWIVGNAERSGGHAHVWVVARDLYHHQAEFRAQVISIVLRVCFVILAFQVVAVTLFGAALPLLRIMHLMGG